MGLVVLFQALPAIAATGATTAVRLAGGGSRPYTGSLGFNDWRSGLKGLPRFTTELGFDQSGWTGGAIPQTALVGFQSADRALMSTLAALFWKGARVLVQSGDDTFGPPSSWKTEMTGTVADASVRDGVLQFVISDLSGDLAKPTVVDTFAGTGGIEGPDEATGRLKRRSWGRVFNVEGRILDKANRIYEFGDPSRPLQAFDLLKDKGRAGDMTVLAWQGSIAATFAALQGASAPSGGGVVAPSIACAKWWTTPGGPLTADLRGETLNGYAETPTDIASRIVATRSTINPAFVLNASRAYAAGFHADDPNETIGNALDRLLLPCSLQWSLTPAGVVVVGEWTWTGSIETLASQEVSRETVLSPLSTRKLGFQRNQRIQNDAEISAALLQASDATYADGTPIEVLKPAQANADRTAANTAASITGQAPAATDISIQPGATRDVVVDTRNTNSPPSYYRNPPYNKRLNVEFKALSTLSAGFGAGAYGFLETVAPWGDNSGGPVTQRITDSGGTRYIRYSTNDDSDWTSWQPEYSGNRKPFFGSDLLEQAGGALATLAAFKTILGNAAGFQGQGSLATLSSLANGGPYLTGFGGLSSLTDVIIGPGRSGAYGLLTQNGFATSDAQLVTIQGMSASFYGQTAWATFTTSTGRVSRLADDGTARLGTGNTLLSEAGDYWITNANAVTSLGTAASIFGQGFGATAARSAVDNTYNPRGVNLIPNSDNTFKNNWNCANYFLADASALTRNPLYASQTWGTDTYALGGKTRNVYVYQANYAGEGAAADYGLIDDNGNELEVTCVPGERLIGSYYGAAHRCSMSIYLVYIKPNGAVSDIASVSDVATRPSTEDNTNSLAKYRRVSVVGVVPSDAVRVRIRVRKESTYAGQTNSYFWWAAPMIERANASQTEPSPYSSGPSLSTRDLGFAGDLDSNNTGRNQAASVFGQGSLATQNNVSYSTQIAGLPGALQPSSFFPSGFMYASVLYANDGNRNLNEYFPVTTGSDRTANANSAGFTGQGGLATLNQVVLNTTTIRMADGTTIVSETLVVTSYGNAAGIAGQGRGATSNNLADLDPTANGKLNATTAGQKQTVALGQTITRLLDPGAVASLYAAIFREAGGNNGTVRVAITGGPQGGAQTTLIQGPGQPGGPGEPAGDEVSYNFTNNTGVRAAFTFSASSTSTGGGAVRQSQSYLQG